MTAHELARALLEMPDGELRLFDYVQCRWYSIAGAEVATSGKEVLYVEIITE